VKRRIRLCDILIILIIDILSRGDLLSSDDRLSVLLGLSSQIAEVVGLLHDDAHEPIRARARE